MSASEFMSDLLFNHREGEKSHIASKKKKKSLYIKQSSFIFLNSNKEVKGMTAFYRDNTSEH